ncbi:hypothetical protein [Amphritea pacifica]|uniref:hypothetical protein n=1 Tax=Amphritea pacifica TaxID=2811233 RepID=UPI0019632666|nr:hypothetical protein [Amphritea pacifica]MBN1005667.1 hypothetical protein [Amphritea pacifica]
MLNSFSSTPFMFNPGLSQPGASGVGTAAPRGQSSPVSGTEEGSSPAAVASRQSYSLKERFNRDDSFTINLTTQDGDQVEITFNSETRYQSDYSLRSGPGRESQRYSIEKNQSSDFGFTVEGELDVEEIDAIASLVQDLSSLASSFFNGDLQTALQQAGDLTLDPEQLAQMDISMQQSIEYRAIEKYRQVQAMGDEAPAASQHALAPFIEQLQNQVSSSEQHVANATEFSMSLFVNLVQHDVRFTSSSETRQNSMQENITRLGEMVHNRHHGHDRHEHEDDHENRAHRSHHNRETDPAAAAVSGDPVVDAAATDAPVESSNPVAETA